MLPLELAVAIELAVCEPRKPTLDRVVEIAEMHRAVARQLVDELGEKRCELTSPRKCHIENYSREAQLAVVELKCTGGRDRTEEQLAL